MIFYGFYHSKSLFGGICLSFFSNHSFLQQIQDTSPDPKMNGSLWCPLPPFFQGRKDVSFRECNLVGHDCVLPKGGLASQVAYFSLKLYLSKFTPSIEFFEVLYGSCWFQKVYLDLLGQFFWEAPHSQFDSVVRICVCFRDVDTGDIYSKLSLLVGCARRFANASQPQ